MSNNMKLSRRYMSKPLSLPDMKKLCNELKQGTLRDVTTPTK